MMAWFRVPLNLIVIVFLLAAGWVRMVLWAHVARRLLPPTKHQHTRHHRLLCLRRYRASTGP